MGKDKFIYVAQRKVYNGRWPLSRLEEANMRGDVRDSRGQWTTKNGGTSATKL